MPMVISDAIMTCNGINGIDSARQTGARTEHILNTKTFICDDFIFNIVRSRAPLTPESPWHWSPLIAAFGATLSEIPDVIEEQLNVVRESPAEDHGTDAFTSVFLNPRLSTR